MPKDKLFRVLSQLVDARLNCLKKKPVNQEWADRHEDSIVRLARNYLPSGSGFDNGTTVDLKRSTGDRLVLDTSFHHMNDAGVYDGWTDHTVTVKPRLSISFSLTISGPNRRDIKDLIGDTFHTALSEVVSDEARGGGGARAARRR
jgi:hypothetical protein